MSFWKSLKHAWRGLRLAISTERNFQRHIVIGLVVVLVAWWRHLSDEKWIALLLVIAMILALEIFNSAIERLVDVLAPKTHNYAKEIKDLLAGMVLLASIFAVIVGLIIFL